jgi:hypothetical protein
MLKTSRFAEPCNDEGDVMRVARGDAGRSLAVNAGDGGSG